MTEPRSTAGDGSAPRAAPETPSRQDHRAGGPAAQRYGFDHRPEPRSIGRAVKGQEIVGGVLRLSGGALTGDPFGQPSPSPDYAAELHGFGWLDDLTALGSPPARDLAQRRVLDWVRRHPAPPAPAPALPAADPELPLAPVAAPLPVEWQPDIVGRRVLRWLFNAGSILPGLDRDAAAPFFDSLHAQLAHLDAHDGASSAGLSRLEALAGLAIGAMTLTGAAIAPAEGLRRFADAAGVAVREEAMRGRNPEALLSCLSLLAWTRAVAEDTGNAAPAAIAELIEEIAPVLRALRHADGGLPRFHGGGRGAPGRLDHGLRAARGSVAVASGHPLGFARLARGRATLILDAAAPPAGAAAAHAHASTLALEFTHARHPIVVNCGPGRMFGPDWARASRATACHSTLSLSGLSSAKLLPPDGRGQERLTLLPQRVWAGACDADGVLQSPDHPPPPQGRPQQILAGHDAWRGSHGLDHLRELFLTASGDALRGEDTLAALDDEAQARLDETLQRQPDGIGFDIRFHLHPDVSAALDGDEVRLDLPGGETWFFSHDMVAELALDASAYLEAGQPEPLPAWQIVLSHRLTEGAVQIGWTFTRAGAR